MTSEHTDIKARTGVTGTTGTTAATATSEHTDIKARPGTSGTTGTPGTTAATATNEHTPPPLYKKYLHKKRDPQNEEGRHFLSQAIQTLRFVWSEIMEK